MHDLLVFGAIVWWIVASVIKAARQAKKAPPPPPGPKPVNPARAKTAYSQAKPPAGGYAGRDSAVRNPDHYRAMSGASPRLAEGAEYPAIVAEREADRAAEKRFSDEVSVLIKSEPTRARPVQVKDQTTATTEPQLSFLKSQGPGANDDSALLNAVILAQVLGPPLSKKTGGRQLRR